jgi:DNA transformation protein
LVGIEQHGAIIRPRPTPRSPFSDIDMGQFVEHVIEILRAFGPVEPRRMFGGWGLYHQGVFFALILGDTLYFKTDDENRAAFDVRGLQAFTFEKKGERIVTHYYAAPEEALEDPAEAARWARSGYAAALRAAAAKATKSRARPKRPAAKPRS